MRTASSESPNHLLHPAVAMSSDVSPPPVYRLPLQSNASIPPCIGDARDSSFSSPWRGRGAGDTTSLCDETRSLCSSVRSTRRRRGGDVSGSAAGEGKDWTRAFMDLERMRRENQELLHSSLRGDRSDNGSFLDDAFARSRSGSSALSSVRRRRRGVATGITVSEGRFGSCAPFEHFLSGSPAVADSAIDTPKAETPAAAPATDGVMSGCSYGGTNGAADARLTLSPLRAVYSPENAEKQSRSSVPMPMPGRTSGLPNWLKRSTFEASQGSIVKAVASTSEAAAVVAAEVTEGADASMCVPATPAADSPNIDVSVQQLREAAHLSSLSPRPAHANSSNTPSTLLAKRTHTDPVGAGALLPSRASRSRTDKANPRGAVPIVYAASSPSTTAAAALIDGSKAACHPTRASQSLAARHMDHHGKVGAAAAAPVGIRPSSPPRGNASLHRPSGKVALATVSFASSTPAAALTAAVLADASPDPSPEAPIAAACAPRLTEEKHRTSARCVSASVAFEEKPTSPDPQPQPPPAQVEGDWGSTAGSSKAAAYIITAAVEQPESPFRAPGKSKFSASCTRTLPGHRPASAMRPARGVRSSRTLARLPSGEEVQDSAESRPVARAAASVPRERKHASVVRLREEALSAPSQSNGCEAAPQSNGGLLHRSTTLTELRRQEVLRDRFARERKATEEARARLVAVKQRVASSCITPSARAVAGALETGSLPSRQVSRCRRRTSAVTRLRVSPTLVTVASPSLTALEAPASHLRLSPQDPSPQGAPQSTDGVDSTFSNARKASASIVSTPTAGTSAAGSAYRSRGGVPQSRSSLAGGENFTQLPKPLKRRPLSRARPHSLSAAANTNSDTPSKNAGVQRVEQWVGTMTSHPRPLSLEPEALSPTVVESVSPALKATADDEPAAAAQSLPPAPAAYRTTAISVADTEKLRPMPFCVECGHRHMNDLAKFCALCGQRRAYLCC
ncbi:hypothetical protein LSCM1_02027 [Leishmania martiniquensis]|uniref:Uncharacterized protein n=1 Tax=Leishmania martiniquensis TaxID=1580590 RepID=A0A836GN41_9TRYP|nr:hypothetical protein LSCM1_02027 [Leishmania martiniquensis]